MSELKPCPFCGSTDIEEDWGSTGDCSKGMYQIGWIECNSCKTSVEYEVNDENMDWDTGGAKLRKKWNARTDDNLTERVKELEELLSLITEHDIRMREIYPESYIGMDGENLDRAIALLEKE